MHPINRFCKMLKINWLIDLIDYNNWSIEKCSQPIALTNNVTCYLRRFKNPITLQSGRNRRENHLSPYPRDTWLTFEIVSKRFATIAYTSRWRSDPRTILLITRLSFDCPLSDDTCANTSPSLPILMHNSQPRVFNFFTGQVS